MQNPIILLQTLANAKRKKVVKLFETQSLQTELEFDLILIRLEFRYDNEAD